MEPRIKFLIKKLDLKAHPEGGFFKETFRAKDDIIPDRYSRPGDLVTDIYFLLTKANFSLFHRIKQIEIWNFYEGAPLEIFQIDPNTLELSTQILGDLKNPVYKAVVKPDHWQAAVSHGEYSLAGCCVCPGFEFQDFELLKDNPGYLNLISKKFPDLNQFISRNKNK